MPQQEPVAGNSLRSALVVLAGCCLTSGAAFAPDIYEAHVRSRRTECRSSLRNLELAVKLDRQSEPLPAPSRFPL